MTAIDDRAGGKGLTLDIVVPVYNEREGIEDFHRYLTGVVRPLAADVTIYYVDDGSTDGTGPALDQIAEKDDRVIVISLTRNFGHQAALSAGLRAANADAIVTMDGDGQHPAELIPAMMRLFQHGYDVVLAQRVDASSATFLKRSMSNLFYRFLRRLSQTNVMPGCADYRLLSRRVVTALNGMPEYHRFLRGMVAWLGYPTVIVPYAERPRTTGKTKYSLRKMLRLAMDAVFSFSVLPLRLAVGLGACFLCLAALQFLYVARFWVRGQGHLLAPGWSSLMFTILLVGGSLMVVIGFVGIYVGYVLEEVKRRPVYVVKSLHTSTPGPDQDAP